ncbi:hypothetical protein [Nocardioides alcanivorans]|nr:hypothetical protein [Nocardioides alcanivorans]
MVGIPGLEASVGIVTLGPLDVEGIAPAITRAARDLATRLT